MKDLDFQYWQIQPLCFCAYILCLTSMNKVGHLVTCFMNILLMFC
uniref:Uncharacterized protein n=1 Tax=Aegilops tauschii subsp. strangulata TaxID=200361 RepID=A0A453CP85_AEGTS